MSEQYLSEIRIFSFNFPPRGWAFCNGQTLPIQQNAALFSLLGTFFGGNGVSTFQLPNLQGNAAVHTTPGTLPGLVGGTTAVTLNVNEIPLHLHTFTVSASSATGGSPSNTTPAQADSVIGNAYAPGPQNVAMADGALGMAGSSQPHPNMQPYLVLNACIALSGIFPSRG